MLQLLNQVYLILGAILDSFQAVHIATGILLYNHGYFQGTKSTAEKSKYERDDYIFAPSYKC
jgi:hypothetical protein